MQNFNLLPLTYPIRSGENENTHKKKRDLNRPRFLSMIAAALS
jgi:hypothetical protein